MNASKTLRSIHTIKGLKCRHLSNTLLIISNFVVQVITKTVSSNCKTSAMLFSRHYCYQSTCVGSTATSDVIISASKSIYLSSVVSLKIYANNSGNSVSISSYMFNIPPTSNVPFLKHCLMVSMDTFFQEVWSLVIAFNTWMSSVILEIVFP